MFGLLVVLFVWLFGLVGCLLFSWFTVMFAVPYWCLLVVVCVRLLVAVCFCVFSIFTVPREFCLHLMIWLFVLGLCFLVCLFCSVAGMLFDCLFMLFMFVLFWL